MVIARGDLWWVHLPEPIDSTTASSHTLGMKIAISVPDELSSAVDHYAQSNGVSRSEVYARAVDKFLEQVTAEGYQRRFNELYNGDEAVDPALTEAARITFERNKW